ncbi:MAG: hypothetical protein HRF50_01545 [Phycisphaerae bacterium]|jgi:hypothetical protein
MLTRTLFLLMLSAAVCANLAGCPAASETTGEPNTPADGAAGDNAGDGGSDSGDSGRPAADDGSSGGGIGVLGGGDSGSGSGDGSSGDGTDGGADGGATDGGGTDGSSDGGSTSGDGTDGSGGTGGSTDGGGDGGSGDAGSADGGSIAATTFAGTLSETRTESLNGGAPGSPLNSSTALTLAFDASGLPTQLLIPGFVDSPDQFTTVNAVGEQQTLQQDAQIGSATRSITMVVTASEATYGVKSGQIVLSFTYHAVQGNLTQDGDGTQTIDIAVADDLGTISYTSVTHYDVRLAVTNGPFFDTTNDITLSGTLSRQ